MSLSTLVEEAKRTNGYDQETGVLVIWAWPPAEGCVALDVTPIENGNGGFSAYARDLAGRGHVAQANSIVAAVERALNGYLVLVNNGI